MIEFGGMVLIEILDGDKMNLWWSLVGGIGILGIL